MKALNFLVGRFRARIFVLLVLAAGLPCLLAQDAEQALRLSVTYRTVKNTAKLGNDVRAEADRLEKLALEERTHKHYGAAIKHLSQGIALMRGQKWTPERALSASLTVKLDRVILEPSQSATLQTGQLFELDEKPETKASARIGLWAAAGDEKAEPLLVLRNLENGINKDLAVTPYVTNFIVPEIFDGNYRVGISLEPASGDPVTKTVLVRIERGLASRFADAKQRAGKIEATFKSKQNNSLLSALATSHYYAGLIDLANAGEISFERINFTDALKNAGAIMDSLEAGRDPFAERRGDFKKAYRSAVDGTFQPYRVFIPTNYDASKAYPLVIALHGMGGNENSYFDGYASGAVKQEAQKRGYLLACPKGRQSASMYTGNAEKDVLDVLAQMQGAYQVDSNRVYLTGHSMGGYGTWSVAMNHPEIFAALAPIAGGGNVLETTKLRGIPILVVHGDDDRTVPVIRGREMVSAAKKAGAEVKYIEVPGGNHSGVVVPTFKDVFEWFDTHTRSKRPLVKPEA